MNVKSADPLVGRAIRVASSASWAAWADALGFISELTTESGLDRRLRGQDLVKPVGWRRRIGGRFGVEVDLPAGCYSDDTQLRLATSRSISANGFDVEAFALIELGVWPTYALGGGRGTKAAATNVSKPQVLWYSNFYPGWEKSGGNGAAMRVQPHVWSAPNLGDTRQIAADVLRNSIVTHGSPVALLGSLIHAGALAAALRDGVTPKPETWPDIWRDASEGIRFFSTQLELATIWVPAWERETGESFEASWRETARQAAEMLQAVEQAAQSLAVAVAENDTSSVSRHYESVLNSLHLFEPETSGSGLGTAVAATVLASAFGSNPRGASVVAAQAIGSDTDSIATMAAAICGATVEEAHLPTEVMDASYVLFEALRMAMVGQHATSEKFEYPDLLHWESPRSQLDSVGLIGGDRLALAGLGRLAPVDGTPLYRNKDAAWRWCTTDFGQTVLVKHRFDLRELPDGNVPRTHILPFVDTLASLEGGSWTKTLSRIFGDRTGDTDRRHKQQRRNGSQEKSNRVPMDISLSVDEMIAWIARRGFKDEDIGYGLRRFAVAGTVDQVVAFTAVLRERINRDALS